MMFVAGGCIGLSVDRYHQARLIATWWDEEGPPPADAVIVFPEVIPVVVVASIVGSIAAVSLTAILCEWIIRRRAARKVSQLQRSELL